MRTRQGRNVRSLRTAAPVGIVVVAAWAVAGPAWAQTEPNNLNAMSSFGFTQAFARSECPCQTPCQDDEFSIGDFSLAECFGNFDDPAPQICTSTVLAGIPWALNGLAGAYPPPDSSGGCGVPSGTMVELDGVRVSPEIFNLSGHMYHSWGPGTAEGEVAVFRFSGDPTVFDGIEVLSVNELVSLGLIGATDILYRRTCDPYSACVIDTDIDVTGLADEEIVMFTAVDGPVPEYDVPAMSVLGLALTSLVLLGLGTRAVRARSRGAD